MKILQISDIHIDITATRLGKLKLRDGENITYLERLKLLNTIIIIGEEKKVDFFVLSGDVFNKSKPYPQEYTDLDKVLQRVKNKILMINGNHDEVTQRGCGLDPMRAMGYKVFTSLETENNWIFAPWGTPFNDIQELVNTCSHAPILVFHAGVWSKENHWVEVDGESGNVSLEQLQSLNCQAVMLGHHHSQVNLDSHIWYAGSSEVFTFGEEKDKKGVLLWDINGPDVKVTQISTNKMLPPWITLKPTEFLELRDTKDFPGYIRIKGEVDEKERLQVIKKLKDFSCLDYLLDVIPKAKSKRVFKLKGKNDKEVLKNYLISKDIKNVDELLKLDKEVENE